MFGEVDGHFAFIVCREGRVQVVADKSGTYHVLVAQHGPHFYISTSLVAIADCLPQLTLSRQEALEFINVEATLGQRTLFREIEHTDAGAIIDCEPGLSSTTYYELRDQRVSYAELIDRLDSYHRVFSHVGSLPCSDLSGGHDSRTVVAALTHAGVDFDCNTNQNLTDPQDHEIAQRVAAYLHKPISLHVNRLADFDYDDLVERTFASLEVSRSVFNAVYTPIYMGEKSEASALIFGGYGGELLRDKYARSKSIPDLVRERYISNRIWLPEKTDAAYRDTLIGKFERTLRKLDERDIKKSCEKIYGFEKMRFWGGSRITAFNQYCYRVHPLLDHTLVKHYFDFSLEEKARAKLQRRIMELVPGLSKIPLSSEIGLNVRGRAMKKMKTVMHERNLEVSPDLVRRVRHLRQTEDYRPPAKFAKASESVTPALLDFLSLSRRNVMDATLYARTATLGYVVGKFRDKVRGV